MSAEARLKELKIELPTLPSPLGNYTSAVRTGQLVFLAGHIPIDANGKLEMTGKLGKEITVDQGYLQARKVGLNVLATLQQIAGSLDKVRRVVKVVGFIRSADGFSDQPKVLNGFSDLIVEVFGADVGRHARSAVGVSELPIGAPVEVEIVAELAS